MEQYLPIVLLLVVATGFAAGSFMASRLLGPSRPTGAKDIPYDDNLVTLEERALFADFGEKFGGKTSFGRCLNELIRADFVRRKDRSILEGPLLDTVIKYEVLAPRIMQGALDFLYQGTNDDPDIAVEVEA